MKMLATMVFEEDDVEKVLDFLMAITIKAMEMGLDMERSYIKDENGESLDNFTGYDEEEHRNNRLRQASADGYYYDDDDF